MLWLLALGFNNKYSSLISLQLNDNNSMFGWDENKFVLVRRIQLKWPNFIFYSFQQFVLYNFNWTIEHQLVIL